MNITEDEVMSHLKRDKLIHHYMKPLIEERLKDMTHPDRWRVEYSGFHYENKDELTVTLRVKIERGKCQFIPVSTCFADEQTDV